jgi:hypothetical protein
MDPLYNYTKTIITFLQLIFSKREDFKWTDNENSGILIGDQKALFNEKIPRILVVRGPEQSINLVADNMYQTNTKTGRTKRCQLLQIPFGINIICALGTEAQRLAFYIKESILANRITIHRVGGFHKIDTNISMSPESDFNTVLQPENKQEACLIQLGFNTIVPYTYIVTPVDKIRLKEVGTKIKLS